MEYIIHIFIIENIENIERIQGEYKSLLIISPLTNFVEPIDTTPTLNIKYSHN